MAWALAVSGWAMVVAAIWLGVWAVRQDPRRRGRSIACVAALLATDLALAAWGGPLFTWWVPDWGWDQIHLPCALLTALVILLLPRLPATWLRRPLTGVLVLFVAYQCALAAGPPAVAANAFGLSTARAESDLLQSTGWSCGAASTAVVRSGWGVPTSEYEAALACGTRPWLGTSTLGMREGLLAAGLTPEERYFASWSDLVAAPKPCLACTVIFGGVLHVVAVLRADEASVTVHDPIVGVSDLSRAEFEAQWIGALVFVRGRVRSPAQR